jgi:hypothetical protein
VLFFNFTHKIAYGRSICQQNLEKLDRTIDSTSDSTLLTVSLPVPDTLTPAPPLAPNVPSTKKSRSKQFKVKPITPQTVEIDGIQVVHKLYNPKEFYFEEYTTIKNQFNPEYICDEFHMCKPVMTSFCPNKHKVPHKLQEINLNYHII